MAMGGKSFLLLRARSTEADEMVGNESLGRDVHEKRKSQKTLQRDCAVMKGSKRMLSTKQSCFALRRNAMSRVGIADKSCGHAREERDKSEACRVRIIRRSVL